MINIQIQEVKPDEFRFNGLAFLLEGRKLTENEKAIAYRLAAVLNAYSDTLVKYATEDVDLPLDNLKHIQL